MEFWASALTSVANANENSDLDLPLEIISKTLQFQSLLQMKMIKS